MFFCGLFSYETIKRVRFRADLYFGYICDLNEGFWLCERTGVGRSTGVQNVVLKWGSDVDRMELEQQIATTLTGDANVADSQQIPTGLLLPGFEELMMHTIMKSQMDQPRQIMTDLRDALARYAVKGIFHVI
jgi:hypothetical protein